jgi:hypothetical protein
MAKRSVSSSRAGRAGASARQTTRKMDLYLSKSPSRRNRGVAEFFIEIAPGRPRRNWKLQTTLTGRTRHNLPNPKQDHDGDLDDHVPRNMPV